ncbi:putative bifunctional diguanylate cyclase/phosphodiesterase [Ferrimonas pelagia]|uniref:putative bifunctional diguanylate cyclase/phosphodiesterase n=1 Tax=Ferrimonas pelagia TaxID=1177826 RepID=UPI0031E8B581
MISRRVSYPFALLLGGMLMISYLLLLLFVAYEGQSRLRAHQDNELTLRVQSYARDLQYVIGRSEKNLRDVAEDKVVYTYFANRALGMSMAYGLGASQHKLSGLLQDNQEGHLREGVPVYSRLAILDVSGQVIADTGQNEGRFVPLPQDILLASSPRRSLLIQPRDQTLLFYQLVPVYRHEQLQAILVAELNPAQLLRLIARKEHQDQASRVQLMTPNGALLAWDSYSTTVDHQREQPIRQEVEIDGQRLEILGWFESLGNRDLFTSNWFIAAISLLAFPVIAGGIVLLRINNNNLVLETRVDLAAQQQQRLAQQNQLLQREVEKRQRSQRQLAYQANHDVLTGLPNRKAGQDALERAIRQARLQDSQVLLMFIDLDNFKHINDTKGHHYGDQLLVQSAGRLRTLMREGDTLARFGGDEFLIILSDVADRGAARGRAEALLRLFDQPFDVDGEAFHVSTSIGMTLYPEDGNDANELIQRSDAALYRVKERGRNGFSFYDAIIDQMARRRLKLDAKLRAAIEQAQLEIHYQPILALEHQQIIGAEALVRWHDPELGPISPAEFIPLAESNGLIHRLGEQVLSTACRQAAEWQALCPLQLSVNVSSVQFHQGERLLAEIRRVLASSALPPQCLTIEVTESLLLGNHKDLNSQLQSLADSGISLAIDDFGTGYSALSYLQAFPFDKLKIDRSFLRHLDRNQADKSLVQAILAMAQALGLQVVAEGIEEAWQGEFLIQHGCQFGQGFYYGRPVPAEAFEAMLRDAPRLSPLPVADAVASRPH